MVALYNPKPRFRPGRIVATRGALQALAASGRSPREFLRRHLTGDWGDVSTADAQANDDALAGVDRLLSSYRTRLGVRIWILTEADRSATTLLLPEEY